MDMMQIVKDVDALVLFYIIVALTSYGITSVVCDIFRWVHKKWKNRKSRDKTDKENEDITE